MTYLVNVFEFLQDSDRLPYIAAIGLISGIASAIVTVYGYRKY